MLASNFHSSSILWHSAGRSPLLFPSHAPAIDSSIVVSVDINLYIPNELYTVPDPCYLFASFSSTHIAHEYIVIRSVHRYEQASAVKCDHSPSGGSWHCIHSV